MYSRAPRESQYKGVFVLASSSRLSIYRDRRQHGCTVHVPQAMDREVFCSPARLRLGHGPALGENGDCADGRQKAQGRRAGRRAVESDRQHETRGSAQPIGDASASDDGAWQQVGACIGRDAEASDQPEEAAEPDEAVEMPGELEPLFYSRSSSSSCLLQILMFHRRNETYS